MNAIELLRLNYQTMHEFLENTLAGVTAEQANWRPPGIANSIGANYGHIVASEDGVVNGMLKGSAPLLAASFAGKTGMSEPPPQGFAWHDWATGVVVDLPLMQEYARAVYAATDTYLASLSEADLERELEMGELGKRSLGWFLTIMGGNIAWHTGEIAALKGEQGLKGYAV